MQRGEVGVAEKKKGGCCWGTLVMKRVWCSEYVCVCAREGKAVAVPPTPPPPFSPHLTEAKANKMPTELKTSN